MEFDTFYLGIVCKLGPFIPTVSVIFEEVHLETCITITPPEVHIETFTQEEPRDEYLVTVSYDPEQILTADPQRFF